MKTKKFDCIEMKRRGAERIYQELKDKTVEEQIEYWRKGTEEMKRRRDEKQRQRALRD